MKAKYYIVFTTALLLTGCSDSFLTQFPENGTLLQDQFNQVDDALEGSVRGIYTQLYEYSAHDEFGQRSIDMYGDINSGDMAMSSSSYGWFKTDELGLMYAYRKGYIWSYYYDIIRLCNNCVITMDAQGLPTPTPDNSLTDVDYSNGYYYGQVLAMRGWAYSGLMRYFAKPSDLISNMETELTIPVYTETEVSNSTLLGSPRSSAAEVYTLIEEDLKTAITYLDAYSKYVTRDSKIEVNADVARGILAYALINKGGKADYDEAYTLAQTIIDGGAYSIIPNDDLLTNGFGNVEDNSWMWGQNVTVETSTALGSFFGQVDIHTYSYAAAGDIKGIDANLLTEITNMGWDGRKNWFRATNPNRYAPDRKFYNIDTKNTTDLNKVDRNWLNDNVFMRIESIYLIAAEASLYKTTPDLTGAENYLDAIMSQRLDTTATAAAAYNTYKATLTSTDALLTALTYNWRVEMWGEGYAMQTLRRLTHTVTLGDNHLRSNKTLDYSTAGLFTFTLPTSETRYNPLIADDQLATAP